MVDIEQYKMSLVKFLEDLRGYILSPHRDIYMARSIAHGIWLSVEVIKRGTSEPIDYSSDLDILLIEKEE